MLVVTLTINVNHEAANIKIVRGDAHGKLPHHFYYHYQADDDNNHRYIGNVLHNYNNGAIALVQKVTRAIVLQQKAVKK